MKRTAKITNPAAIAMPDAIQCRDARYRPMLPSAAGWNVVTNFLYVCDSNLGGFYFPPPTRVRSGAPRRSSIFTHVGGAFHASCRSTRAVTNQVSIALAAAEVFEVRHAIDADKVEGDDDGRCVSARHVLCAPSEAGVGCRDWP